MTESIIVAIIAGILPLIGVIISNNSSQKLTAFKIDEYKADTTSKLNEMKADTADKLKDIKDDFTDLRAKVEKHNNLVERMAIVEQSAKSAHKRLDDMKKGA